jgi:hypothetical protein
MSIQPASIVRWTQMKWRLRFLTRALTPPFFLAVMTVTQILLPPLILSPSPRCYMQRAHIAKKNRTEHCEALNNDHLTRIIAVLVSSAT